MKRPVEIKEEERTMDTLLTLTSAFEGIASFHLAKIRLEVLKSDAFFNELWKIYTKIRVDKFFHFGRGRALDSVIDKDLYIVITAEGGFSGDVDQRIISKLQKDHDPLKQDIIVVGQHGVALLNQLGVKFVKFYSLPINDININVSPLVQDVQKYRSTTVFYSHYITLSNQTIEKITLSALVQEMGKSSQKIEGEITESSYIFEPSNYAVIEHLEQTMLFISLAQLILGSKLAQYASRFRSMTEAKRQAEETSRYVRMQYRQSVRAQNDERSKETINSLRKSRSAA